MEQKKKGPGAPTPNDQATSGQKMKKPKPPEIGDTINAIEETENNDMIDAIDEVFGNCGC